MCLRSARMVGVQSPPSTSNLTPNSSAPPTRVIRSAVAMSVLEGTDVREHGGSAQAGAFDDGHRRAERSGDHSGFVTTWSPTENCDTG